MTDLCQCTRGTTTLIISAGLYQRVVDTLTSAEIPIHDIRQQDGKWMIEFAREDWEEARTALGMTPCRNDDVDSQSRNDASFTRLFLGLLATSAVATAAIAFAPMASVIPKAATAGVYFAITTLLIVRLGDSADLLRLETKWPAERQLGARLTILAIRLLLIALLVLSMVGFIATSVFEHAHG